MESPRIEFETQLFNHLIDLIPEEKKDLYKSIINIQEYLNVSFRDFLKYCTYAYDHDYDYVNSFKLFFDDEKETYVFNQYTDEHGELLSNRDDGSARQIIRTIFNQSWKEFLNKAYKQYLFSRSRSYEECEFSKLHPIPMHLDMYERVESVIVEYFSLYTNNVDYHTIIAIAGENYERQGSSGCIAFTPNLPEKNVAMKNGFFVLFEKESQLNFCVNNKRAIRKQLQMTGEKGCLVVAFDAQTNQHITYGLINIDKAVPYPIVEFFEGAGWRFYFQYIDKDNDGNEITQRKIQFEYRSSHFWIPRKEYNYQLLVDLLKKRLNIAANSEACKKIQNIVRVATKQRHGTSIIVANDEECNRLCKGFNRGYSVQHKSSCDTDEYESQLLGLTAIDGAVMINRNGDIIGIGTILDGKATVKGDSSRGARYNSINNYVAICNKNEPPVPCLGVIVSEDGIVNLV